MQQSDGYSFLFMFSGPEAAGKDSEIITVNGILGESVTFPVNIQEPQQVKNIAWTSKTSVAYVTPGDSEMAPRVAVTHRNYYERIHALGPKYDLVISNLRMEDAGDYKADINTQAEPYTTTKCYNLQVYRKSWEDGGLFIFTLQICYLKHIYISDNWVP